VLYLARVSVIVLLLSIALIKAALAFNHALYFLT
jgi:hypothetical protein